MNEDLVTVYTAGRATLAEIIRNGLQSEGIHAVLEGVNESVNVGLVPDVKVLVAADDADRARKWIHQHEHRVKHEHRAKHGEE